MSVDYNHSVNIHTLTGPRAALPVIFSGGIPKSLADVGCGLGTWAKAAMEIGVGDVLGIDGVDVPENDLLISKDCFKQVDLTQSWSLGRRFDYLLCLEVAEHLPRSSAEVLIRSLCEHADKIVFSAAPPGQTGQNHINCQWPSYWQEIFNKHGFIFEDNIRWKLWEDERIEFWYRQNLFIATKSPALAGKEARVQGVVHPSLLETRLGEREQKPTLAQIEKGEMPFVWYLLTALRVFPAKVIRLLRSGAP